MKNKFLKILFALIAIIGFTAISGCKKGENDPLISLKTRKGRITGEWKLIEGTITETETNGGSTGSSVVTYTSSTSNDGGTIGSYTETITIERDGTYEKTITQNGSTLIIKGNWYFSGKSDDIDLKKKEAIVFSETEYVHQNGTISYTGLYANQILLIDQLKNKELIFKGVITSQSGGDSESYSYDRTFEKQ